MSSLSFHLMLTMRAASRCPSPTGVGEGGRRPGEGRAAENTFRGGRFAR